MGGAPAVTARRPLPRWLVLLALTVVSAVVYLGVVAAGQTDGEQAVAPTDPGEPTSLAAAPRRDADERADRSDRLEVAADTAPQGTPFAHVEGLQLSLPHADPVAVAFHEASLPDALELQPEGQLVANDNTTKFTPPEDVTDGPAYRVLSSRGRPRPATSAVDVVLPEGGTVVSPVEGTVVEAREYLLYGNLRDWRVVVRPDDQPQLHVVMIHLHRPAVRAGDRVSVGSPLAVARLLPFTSHVDYVTEDHKPHVHLEVKPATAPAPVDPNEPARDAEEKLREVTGQPLDGG